MTIPVHQIIFYIYSAILIAAASMVIFSRNPVKAVLFLIVCFFASSILWLLLQAEFMGLVLIFVYVGAVMALFLFVVMMLNIDLATIKEGFVKLLPLGLIVMVLFILVMYLVITQYHFHTIALPLVAEDYSNTKEIGTLLFSDYVYPFEIAGALLLVAIVAAISLAFTGRKPGVKRQNNAEQQRATKQDRLKIIKNMGSK